MALIILYWNWPQTNYMSIVLMQCTSAINLFLRCTDLVLGLHPLSCHLLSQQLEDENYCWSRREYQLNCTKYNICISFYFKLAMLLIPSRLPTEYIVSLDMHILPELCRFEPEVNFCNSHISPKTCMSCSLFPFLSLWQRANTQNISYMSFSVAFSIRIHINFQSIQSIDELHLALYIL